MGPLGDLSETRGEACDASQILSDRAENHKRVLFTKLYDWVELGVPIGHRARIIKEHKALHPELW